MARNLKKILLFAALTLATALFAISTAEENMILERLKSDRSLQNALKSKTQLNKVQTENAKEQQGQNTTDESNLIDNVYTASELQKLGHNKTVNIVKDALKEQKRRVLLDILEANQEIFDSYFVQIGKKDILEMSNDDIVELLALQFKEMEKEKLDSVYLMLKKPYFSITKYKQIFEKKELYYEGLTPFTYEDSATLLEKLEKSSAVGQNEQPLKKLTRFGANFFENKNKEYLTNTPVPDNYVISQGDIINLSIYGIENVDVQLEVNKDGTINIPKVGAVKVAGMDYLSAKSMLENKLKTQYTNATVVFSLGDLKSSTVTISGEVKKPGSYTLNALAKVKDALAAAGGISDTGSMRNIQVLRNGRVVARFDLYKIIRGGREKGDIVLRAGDIVNVPVAENLIEFSGSVKIPAIYELKNGETLQDLLKISGGVSSDSVKLLKIERTTGNHKEFFEVSLLSKTKLQDGDKIFTDKLTDVANNRIFLKGNVFSKGAFEISKNETVGSFLKKQISIFGVNKFFMPDTDMDYFLVKRVNPETSKFQVLSGSINAALKGEKSSDIKLISSDELYIFNKSMTEDVRFVTVEGEVSREGKFKYFSGMKLLDALKTAGLKKDSDTNKIRLLRQDENKTLKVSFHTISEAAAVELKAYDRISVDNFFQTRELPTVKITGAVNQPGDFNATENLTINKLIDYAKGLSEKAYKDSFELTSFIIEKGVRKPITKRLSLSEAIASDLKINPYDHVHILQIANWDSNRSVTISGQVKHPGEYSIAPGEKIANVIARAGGFLPQAFVDGTILTREDVKKMQKEALKRQIDELESKITYLATQVSGAGEKQEDKAMMLKTLEVVKEGAKKIEVLGRVSVRLDRNLDRLASSIYNIVLKPGDKIIVPEQEDSILVIGEVMNQAAVTFKPDEDVMSYIARVGGLKESADEDAIFILRANGEAERVKRGYMLGYGSTIVRRGDTVVVPLKVGTFSGIQFAKDLSSIFYQMAVAAAALKSIGTIR